jgi:hypothetical protein
MVLIDKLNTQLHPVKDRIVISQCSLNTSPVWFRVEGAYVSDPRQELIG